MRTASGNVASMRKPLDGSLWFCWIVAQEANQNGGCFENYHLRYLFSLCGVQKGQSFCVICGKGLTASKSQRRAQFRAVSGNISDIVSCFGLHADTSRIDGVLCNSCRTALLKYRKTGKKSLHVSSDRVKTCYLCA